jgi:hypothetical protein
MILFGANGEHAAGPAATDSRQVTEYKKAISISVNRRRAHDGSWFSSALASRPIENIFNKGIEGPSLAAPLK